MMKKLIALILIGCFLCTSLYITTCDVTAASNDIMENIKAGPIYKVIVPTDYSFTIDPCEMIDEGSMIGSSNYYIINKSNVPVNLDVSFKISAGDGIMLDVKPTKEEVTGEGNSKQIWFAAAMPLSLATITRDNMPLLTVEGKQVYYYGDRYSTKSMLENTKVVKDTVELLKNIDDEQNLEIKLDKSYSEVEISTVTGSSIGINEVSEAVSTMEVSGTTAVSGSAVNVNAVTGNAIEANQTIAVTGSAIEVNQTTAVTGSAIEGSQTTAVTGSAIDINGATAVTGSAIEVSPTIAVTGSTIGISDTTAVTGGAIEVSGKTTEKNGNMKADIIAVVSDDAININDIEQVSDKDLTSGIISLDFDNDGNTTKMIYGKPILYTDTIALKGYYGRLADLNEKSNQVLTIGKTFTTMTFALEAAHGYYLEDGTALTGEVANDNKGVAVFRFIGAVNTNTNWANADVKVIVQYQLTSSAEEDTLSMADNNAKQVTATDEKENVKTEFNDGTMMVAIIPEKGEF